MGGRGSGRHRSYQGKPETLDCTPLDIRRLARNGALVPGFRGAWQWTVDECPTAAITIRAGESHFGLSWKVASTGQVCHQVILLTRTDCHLGGARTWFQCPSCGARVAVIYAPGHYFACRRCTGVKYPSQGESPGDRAARKADRIRSALGWPIGILNGPGPKPRRMHWERFCRLSAKHNALVEQCLEEAAARFGWRE